MPDIKSKMYIISPFANFLVDNPDLFLFFVLWFLFPGQNYEAWNL